MAFEHSLDPILAESVMSVLIVSYNVVIFNRIKIGFELAGYTMNS